MILKEIIMQIPFDFVSQMGGKPPVHTIINPSMVASVPIPGTRVGLPVYIPHLRRKWYSGPSSPDRAVGCGVGRNPRQ